MKKEAIVTANAPAAIGPYSAGIAFGDLVFTSGQLPLNPQTGTMCDGTVGEMTTQSLNNVAAILEAAGSSMEKVVKTTIYLQDMNDFAEVNAAYEKFFTVTPPARSCVQVAALPKTAKVEIEALAVK